MKKHPFLFCTLFVGVLALSISPLDAQEPTEADKAKFLKALEQLKSTINGGMNSNNMRALQLFQSAVSSPKNTLTLYMDSRKAVEFDEEGKEEAIWRAWKDQNEEGLKETGHVKALQFQLTYLILSIQATSGDDPEETLKQVMPKLIVYLTDLSENYDSIANNSGILRGSVLDSVFAKKAKLNVTVDRKRPWVFNPLSVSEIYERSILPFYRAIEDHTNIQAAWDKRIVHEGKLYAAANRGGNYSDVADRLRSMKRSRVTDRDRDRAEEEEADRNLKQSLNNFKAERMPVLVWGKLRDGLLFGTTKSSSIDNMLTHIKNNLDHPEAKRWLEELSNFINADVYDSESYYRKKEEEELKR